MQMTRCRYIQTTMTHKCAECRWMWFSRNGPFLQYDFIFLFILLQLTVQLQVTHPSQVHNDNVPVGTNANMDHNDMCHLNLKTPYKYALPHPLTCALHS